MSKKNTRLSSYDLLRNSFRDLFHPTSKNALIDYSYLNVVDWSSLNVIDWQNLKLVDADQLKLVNVSALVFFFEYVGAFAIAILIMLGLLVGITDPQVRVSTDLQTAVSDFTGVQYASLPVQEEPRKVPAQAARPEKEVVVVAEVVSEPVELAQEYGVFSEEYAIAVATRRVAVPVIVKIDKPKGMVAGVMDAISPTAAIAAEEISNDDPIVHACSFNIDDYYYSHGAEVALDVVGTPYVCANYNGDVSNSVWELVGTSPLNRTVVTSTDLQGDCMQADSVSSGYSLEVTVYDDTNGFVDTCVLNFE